MKEHSKGGQEGDYYGTLRGKGFNPNRCSAELELCWCRWREGLAREVKKEVVDEVEDACSTALLLGGYSPN